MPVELGKPYVMYDPNESKEYVCPMCGEEYSDGALCLEDKSDDYIIIKFDCPACGATGNMYRKIVFDGYIMKKKG